LVKYHYILETIVNTIVNTIVFIHFRYLPHVPEIVQINYGSRWWYAALNISGRKQHIYIYSVNGLRANTDKHTSGSHSEILQIRRKPWPVRLPIKSAFFRCEYHMICYDVPSPLTLVNYLIIYLYILKLYEIIPFHLPRQNVWFFTSTIL
jgi:hypothetical protein